MPEVWGALPAAGWPPQNANDARPYAWPLPRTSRPEPPTPTSPVPTASPACRPGDGITRWRPAAVMPCAPRVRPRPAASPMRSWPCRNSCSTSARPRTDTTTSAGPWHGSGRWWPSTSTWPTPSRAWPWSHTGWGGACRSRRAAPPNVTTRPSSTGSRVWPRVEAPRATWTPGSASRTRRVRAAGRPPHGTWGRRGRTPVITVTGAGRGRVSVAALCCYKPGNRPRLLYRLYL
ncbi:hypothetical protein ABH917_001096 [Thermobifida halotolerans]